VTTEDTCTTTTSFYSYWQLSRANI